MLRLRRKKRSAQGGMLVFIGAGLIILLIATFTVSFWAMRAARTDPVKALRHK